MTDRVYAIDPRLVEKAARQTSFKDKELSVVIKLSSQIIVNPFAIALDDPGKQLERSLVEVYSQIESESLIKEFLGELLEGSPSHRKRLIAPGLNNENIIHLLNNSKCTENQRILIGMADQNPNITVLLADPDGSGPGLTPGEKAQICDELRRQSIYFASEFIQVRPIITGEGDTDWKYLKSAYLDLRAQGIFTDENLYVDFLEYDTGGWTQLIRDCEKLVSNSSSDNLYIAVFDRDVFVDGKDKIEEELSGREQPAHNGRMANENGFYYLGNKVYSLQIPLPSYRPFPAISIELYYQDEEITREDQRGDENYRLFLSSEFDNNGIGKYHDRDVICSKNYKERISGLLAKGSNQMFIIDEKVRDKETGKDYSLRKGKFAENILNKKANFDNFIFDEFNKIYAIIEQIVADNQLP